MKKSGRVLAVNMLIVVFVVVLFSLSFAIDAIKPQDIFKPQVPAPDKTPILKGICLPVNFTSFNPLLSAIIGQQYQYQLKASGGSDPITFEIIGGYLPKGLNMSPNGLISGSVQIDVPARIENGVSYSLGCQAPVGGYTFIVKAKSNCQGKSVSYDKLFILNVAHSCDFIYITSESTLPAVIVGNPYKYQILASGGKAPFSFDSILTHCQTV